ncbi:chorismate-binding protein [Vibrio chagasii]|nr:chorismate-binding protein [Vibrio chagasii]
MVGLPKNLGEYNSAPFSGFIRLANSAIIWYLTRTLPRAKKDNVIETKPIKVLAPVLMTNAIGDSNAQDLASADKDRAENLMIVDLAS